MIAPTAPAQTLSRPGTAPAAGYASLAGTGELIRLALRRDRVMLPIWIVILAGTAASSASATEAVYPDAASRAAAAGTINNTPALVALYGRIYDETSLGAISLLKLGGAGAALAAVLAVILVVRHTRAEEETGRLELLGATVVGRYAPLTAALAVAAGSVLVLGLVTAAALTASGLPAAGSFAFGLSWAASGLAFAAVAAVAAQLTIGARAAIGIAVAVLGTAYVLRAVGDTAGDGGPVWATWLSPIGWSQQTWPFAGERWWVLALPVLFAAALTAAAYALVSRRDLGAGLFAGRPGSPAAGPLLSGPLTLAWRLQRGTLLAWSGAFLLLGFVVGNIAASVGSLLDSPQARDIFVALGGKQGLTDAFLAAELGFMGVIASVFAVTSTMRLRAEETALRAEPLLATPVGRTRWASSHLIVAVAGSAFLLALAGAGAGTAHAMHTGDPAQLPRLLGAALAQLPGPLVLIGITVAAFGFAPRFAAAGWAALVAFLLIGEIGPILQLNQWVMDLSPYTHIPRLPGGPFEALPVVVLTILAAVLTAAGLAAFRRRDIG